MRVARYVLTDFIWVEELRKGLIKDEANKWCCRQSGERVARRGRAMSISFAS